MSTQCPDCKGTGVYVGLTTREPCRTCGHEPKACKHGTDGADEDTNLCSDCCAEMRAAIEDLTGVEQVIANDLGLPKEILFHDGGALLVPYPQHADCRCMRHGDARGIDVFYDCEQRPLSTSHASMSSDGNTVLSTAITMSQDDLHERIRQRLLPTDEHPGQLGSMLKQVLKSKPRNYGATREMVGHAIDYAVAEGQFIGAFIGEQGARIALRWAVEARSQIMERGLPLRASVDGHMITITSVTLPPITYAVGDSET